MLESEMCQSYSTIYGVEISHDFFILQQLSGICETLHQCCVDDEDIFAASLNSLSRV